MNLELKNKVIDFILDNKELENITTHINCDNCKKYIKTCVMQVYMTKSSKCIWFKNKDL